MHHEKQACELTQQFIIKKANKITLWHVAKSNLKNNAPKGFFVKRDEFDTNKVFDNLKSFLDNGIMPTGKGYGGQQDGFYVFNHKHIAYHYFYNRLTQYKDKEHPECLINYAGEALLVSVTINKDELTYPNWQFDLEGCDVLSPLLYKHKDLICSTILKHKDKAEIISFKNADNSTPDNCLITKITKTPESESQEIIRIGNMNQKYTRIFQELCDTMCANQEFQKDYNMLLRESANNYLTLAQMKYCGKQPLPVDEILYLKKDDKGTMIETPLYLSTTCSMCKEKHICPFLKLKTAKEKL